MNKLRTILLSLLFVCVSAVAASAQELSTEARQFRTNILSFLREEGFNPSLDDNGSSIYFTREGYKYKLDVSGSMPVRVSMDIWGFNNKDADILTILVTCNDVNKEFYYVKAFTDDLDDDGSVYLTVEIPCHTAEEFRYVFMDCARSLSKAKEYFSEQYNTNLQAISNQNTAPFEITGVAIANVDSSGKVLSTGTIYSSSSRYIRPKLTIRSAKSGKYDIYYKLYLPDGTLSTGTNSPSGYTSSSSISIYAGEQQYELRGWGNNTPGYWKAGTYRYEFYCEGAYLGYYELTIR